jgi:type I restriction enzyme M protein
MVGRALDQRPDIEQGREVNSFSEKVSFIWSIADLLRGDYKQSEYGRVILPLTVLRRVETLSKENDADFAKLAARPGELPRYLKNLPAEVREIFDCFRFREEIARLHKAGLLELVLRRFGEIDLTAGAVSNHEMGYIFEELIRKFSEQSHETAGEHFTPREVVRLMVRLVFEDDSGAGKTLYDPACGTGGMLSVAEEYARERRQDARLETYGQELNRESYAVCKADALLRGNDASRIVPGNSIASDGFAGRGFDYMVSNPPFGVDWRKIEKQVRTEHERLGFEGRFGAGLSRVSDGSLLFLQHMLSKMKPEGSRIAVVFNGSPLFTGEAGTGESEIRRWIFENDWLEAVVALPDQLFYNTGLATYVWVLTNRKAPARQGRVQLINAVTFAERMRRSLGAKRNEIPQQQIENICALHREFREGPHSRIVRTQQLGYRRVVVERPLRLNFQAAPERVRSMGDKFAPDAIAALLHMDPAAIYRDQPAFYAALSAAFASAGLKLGRTLARRIGEALAQHDDTAEIYRDAKGRPVPDPELRDCEDIPLDEDVSAWFNREVLPHAPDAWIAAAEARTGYAIPFARFFFESEPVRPVAEIDREIRDLEREAQALLRELGAA